MPRSWRTTAPPSPADNIRPARPDEIPALAALAFEAKASHGYDDAFMERVREALVPVRVDVLAGSVLVAEARPADACGPAVFAGWGALAWRDDGERYVEDLWVAPARQRCGVGTSLLRALLSSAGESGDRCVFVESDPHAVAFYRRHGAVDAGEITSRATGRSLPRLRFDLAVRP